MADIIELLPDHVANQIAAGEVVQRPASVVKELLENSIDAGATYIKLVIKDAGKTLVQVIDDGMGMSVTDARLCFERHATSKIRSAEDLFGIHTKGFRGEALASIGAIAHVELQTKTDGKELGTTVIMEGSEVKSQEASVVPKGTAISVKHLFFNIPARRNFLKSDTVELRHVIDEFHRVALAHPNVAFSMWHNGTEMFSTPSSNFRQRIVNLFGFKMNEKLVPVNEATELVDIDGFVLKPEFSKKGKNDQYFFVNDRFIKSPYLHHAVKSAFEGLIKDGYQPGYFLKFKVDPKSIDINIHPTKTEIKFDDEHSLYALIRAAVKHSLGQYNVAPVLDFDRDSQLDTPYNYKDKPVTWPTVEVDRNFNPFQEETKYRSSGITNFRSKQKESWESLYVDLELEPKGDAESAVIGIEQDFKHSKIFGEDHTEVQIKTYQIFTKYVITALKSGMLIIDQNRAHQRILYEEYLKQLTTKASVSQQLLFPITLEFTRKEFSVLDTIKEDLAHAGLLYSSVSDSKIEVTGVPIGVPESEVLTIIEDLISDVTQEIPDTNFGTHDMVSKSLSKSLAIKTGQSLSALEQEDLVNRLFACKEPSLSPFNKPIFITMALGDIEKQFKL
ncbi:DNA mismatch repair endonuclease MutL [Aegicerativicinus sediminis]|uniref:DNA mismatch repair endonuclease MutL n=1 Tax=Aegicerativicinus sediminis TaxID=2893202 RepID=UPI001E588A8C|nr:DNA mismatch repair endonuclease MutL [Aegicerativicinus sediminis]